MFKLLAVLCIRVYQLILSPILPQSCRFLPTCSAYGITAINRFGVLRGGRLLSKRICKCHPWGGSGYHPVPLNLND